MVANNNNLACCAVQKSWGWFQLVYVCLTRLLANPKVVYNGIVGFAIGLLLYVQKSWFQKWVLVTGLTHRASQGLFIKHRHFQVLYVVGPVVVDVVVFVAWYHSMMVLCRS